MPQLSLTCCRLLGLLRPARRLLGFLGQTEGELNAGYSPCNFCRGSQHGRQVVGDFHVPAARQKSNQRALHIEAKSVIKFVIGKFRLNDIQSRVANKPDISAAPPQGILRPGKRSYNHVGGLCESILSVRLPQSF